MKPKITDITEIHKIRHALKALQHKIDTFMVTAENIPAREANKHISAAIHNFSNYTTSENYELLRNYSSVCSSSPIFKYFDEDFEKILRKKTFTLEEVFRFGYAVMSTRIMVNDELDYIDRELL